MFRDRAEAGRRLAAHLRTQFDEAADVVVLGVPRGGVVVAVSHADPIKAALAHALGMHLDLFQRLAIAPGSITTIAYGSNGPMVLGMNVVSEVAAS